MRRALTAILIVPSLVLALGVAMATPGFATAYCKAESTGARACYDAAKHSIIAIDTEQDGHHAAAFWSLGSQHDKCEAFKGVNTGHECPLLIPDHATICYRAANMEGDHVVQDRLGREQISPRVCVSTG